MNRVSCILLVMTMVLCSTALPTRAEQSEQEVLSSLNSTLQTVVYSTQNPGNSDTEKWNNSYQFAVTDNLFIITYRWDSTSLKGEEILDHYIETGTYTAPLAMLTHAEISPSPHMIHIAIGCNEEANCFTREYSGEYEQNGKITTSEKTKSVNRIGLILPEELIEPTMDLLKELLYP
jgi:hypothetical protein